MWIKGRHLFLRFCAGLMVLSSTSSYASVRNLIVDHDGAMDDLAALAMVLESKNIKVAAVSICPADSFKEPAIQATVGLIRFLKKGNIDVYASDHVGTNPFPDKWRSDSIRLSKLSQLSVDSPKTKVPSAGPEL